MRRGFLLFVINCINKLIVNNRNMFMIGSSVHSLDTRHKEQFYYSVHKLKLVEWSPDYIEVKLFNKLFKNILILPTTTTKKKTSTIFVGQEL